ncbi:uracil-DNA glycosylase-like [Argiope bruennichi]|uniref:Uracil-DNA glycosylase n=1 Tax=Argiope bruennichi TaxID=94029 RepID=A0A8T0F7T4_ARGBR|nr:uracil-DNA glycosylase-like [Argiope bruennichi]KAF8785499.1 Uracil-DNA glycosylase like protein [Argiope bruennichi]
MKPVSSTSPNSHERKPNERNESDGRKRVESSDPERIKIIKLCETKHALSSNIGLTWFKALEEEFSKDYFAKLSRFLYCERGGYTVCPEPELVYAWTRYTEIQDVKVVILGNEPSPIANKSLGLAFSARGGYGIPESLKNVYKELSMDIEGFIPPPHACLEGWASQGVLLLNICLTVRTHWPKSHQHKGWENFTDAVIQWINSNLSHVVFLLWGKNAQEKSELINKRKHLVLTAAHPSELTAHLGFFSCRHFSKTNMYLKKYNKKPIDWAHLPI